MFLVDKLNENIVSPLKKFQNTVHLIGFIRRSYASSADISTCAKLSLLKPQRHRNEDDFSNIEKLMGRYEYFTRLKQKYGVELFQIFCQFLEFRREDAGHTIIQADQVGTTFYIIIGGKVGIYINKPETNGLPFKQNQQLYKKTMISIKGQQAIKNNLDILQMIQVNTLEVGQSFGEAALLESNAKTSATVITNEICEFACMKRKQFWNILGKFQQTEFSHKMKFLRSLSFLHTLYDQDLKTISYHFTQIKLVKDQVIYKKNDQCNGVYFVVSGSIQIIGKIKYRSRLILDDCEYIKRDNIGEYKNIVLYDLTQGAIFGDEEIVHLEERQYTAVCNSMCGEIYVITYHEIDRRLWWSDNRQNLQDLAHTNQECLQNRQSELGDHEKMRHQEKDAELLMIEHIIKNKDHRDDKQLEIKESNKNIRPKIHLKTEIPNTPNSQSLLARNDPVVRKHKLNSIPGIDFLTPMQSLNNSFTKTQIGQTQQEKDIALNHLQTRRRNQWTDLDIFTRAKLLGLDLTKTSIKDQRRNLIAKNIRFQKAMCKLTETIKKPQRSHTTQSEEQMNPQTKEIFDNKKLKPINDNIQTPNQNYQGGTSRGLRVISEIEVDFATQRKRINSDIPITDSSKQARSSIVSLESINQPIRSRDSTKASFMDGQWSIHQYHKHAVDEGELNAQIFVKAQTTRNQQSKQFLTSPQRKTSKILTSSKFQFRKYL